MPNLFRFACLATLFLMSIVPAFAESSFDREAKRTGYAYAKKMVTVCNGFSYLKSTDEIRRYKGQITIVLHDAPPKDSKKWIGYYEVNAPDDRMNFRNEGWTEPDMPLLFSVQKIRGQWRASGLEKVTCDVVQNLKP